MEAVILGISITRRAVGLALLKGSELVDWSIHTDNTTAFAAASSAIHEHPVSHLSIVASHSKRKEHIKERFAEKYMALTDTRQITTSRHSVYELRKKIPSGRYGSKTALFQYLSEVFPELEATYHKYLQKRNPYLNVVFEAVACAYIAS